jgi:pimeloyl-ACP methyl ester carboxylesterase
VTGRADLSSVARRLRAAPGEDLEKFDVPTLVMHGEDDQIVPVKDSARKSAQLIKARRRFTTRALRTA